MEHDWDRGMECSEKEKSYREQKENAHEYVFEKRRLVFQNSNGILYF